LRNDKRELLLRELKLLDEANKILVYSYEACSEIGIKDNYTLECYCYFIMSGDRRCNLAKS
jgi:hypothetical protein